MILTKMEKIAKVPYLIAVFIMLTNASCKRNTGTESLRKAEVVMVNGESGYSSSELTAFPSSCWKKMPTPLLQASAS